MPIPHLNTITIITPPSALARCRISLRNSRPVAGRHRDPYANGTEVVSARYSLCSVQLLLCTLDQTQAQPCS